MWYFHLKASLQDKEQHLWLGLNQKKKAAAVITFSADLFCTYYSAIYFQFTASGKKIELRDAH